MAKQVATLTISNEQYDLIFRKFVKTLARCIPEQWGPSVTEGYLHADGVIRPCDEAPEGCELTGKFHCKMPADNPYAQQWLDGYYLAILAGDPFHTGIADRDVTMTLESLQNLASTVGRVFVWSAPHWVPLCLVL